MTHHDGNEPPTYDEPAPNALRGGPILLTLAQVAALLQISADMLDKLVIERAIPAPVIRRNGCIRWHKKHLEEWEVMPQKV